jgi:hypothetical protein
MANMLSTEVIRTVAGEVISPADGVVTYAVVVKPFGMYSKRGNVPAGTSLKELADELCPGFTQNFLKLYIGDNYIPREVWHRVRMKKGAHVTGRVVPASGGGGQKSPMRWILQIVIAIVAIVTTVLTWGALGPVWASLLGAAISFGGSMLVNMVAPIKPPKLPDLSSDGADRSQTYNIAGSRNELKPFGIIPRLLGKHRMTPPLGARPFTEIVGEDQYLWQLFIWGHGPLLIEEIKIGETLFSTLQDAQIETVQGYPGEVFETLIYPDVFEESFQVVLENPYENNKPAASLGPDELWVSKVSQLGPKSLSVDITFPNGLVRYKEDGTPDAWSVTIQVRYKKTTDSVWTKLPDWYFNEIETQPMQRGKQWDVEFDPAFQWDVQLRCVSQTLDDAAFNRVMDNVFWTKLRSILPGDPYSFDGLCATVVRVRATKQLNGIIDQLNGIGTSILPVYEGGVWSPTVNEWEPTQNPAALALAIWQGSANARPTATEKLLIDDITAFYEDCKLNGYQFNQVRDFQTSVWEAIQDVCAAGRASPGHRDGKWTIIMDRPQSTPVQMFTPRNSANFKGNINYVEVPHGFRIRFVNELKNYEQDELTVYADGYNESNATIFEGIEVTGITHPDQLWKHGRFQYAQALLRGAETYAFTTDIEHMVCTRGDLIVVSHDVPAWSYSWARIKALLTSGPNTTGLVLDDNVQIPVGESCAVRVRSVVGGNVVITRYDIVSSIAGEFKTVTFITPVATATGPAVGDLCSGGVIGNETRDLVVLGIKPGRDMGATIMCHDYAPEVYDADQGAIPPFESGIQDPLGVGYPTISVIRSDEGVMVRNSDGTLSTRVVLNFAFLSSRLSTATAYEIQAKLSSGAEDTWASKWVEPTFKANVSLEGFVELNTYDFRVRYQFAGGSNFGDWSPVTTHTVIGRTTLPPDVVDARLEGPRENRQIVFRYPNKPIDVIGFYIRANDGVDTNFERAQPLHDGVWSDSPFPLGASGLGTKTILIKAVDAGAFVSANAAVILVNFGSMINGDDVHAVDLKAASFPDDFYNGTITLGNLEANSEGSDLFWLGADSDFFWTAPDSGSFWATGTYLEMTWNFTYQPDTDWMVQDAQIYTTITGNNVNATITWAKSSYFWPTSPRTDADLAWGSDAMNGTSATSMAVNGTTPKAFTTESGKDWVAGDAIRIYSRANNANYIVGTVASYSGTSLSVTVTGFGGSGTLTDWNVSAAPNDADLYWNEAWDGATYWPWLGATNDITDDVYSFRVKVPAADTQASITTARIAMRAPVVSEDVEDLVIATPAGTRVPLTKSYGIIRSVPCDIQQAAGDARSIILVDKDPVNGPLLKAYNAAGTQVAAVVDAHPRGN